MGFIEGKLSDRDSNLKGGDCVEHVDHAAFRELFSE